MSNQSKPESAEERLIARYFKPLATHPGAFGLTDDAAAIAPPAGCDLVLKTDGVIAGVHFFADDPHDTVAKKVLRINLSDLAAKGARPLGFLLALALPQGTGEAWLPAVAAARGGGAAGGGGGMVGAVRARTRRGRGAVRMPIARRRHRSHARADQRVGHDARRGT